MAFKIVLFSTILALANAGVPLGYAAAPAISYSAAAPAISYAAAAPALSYHAPAVASYAHAAPAISYAAPIARAVAPVAYAAPVAKTIVAEPYAPAHYDFGYGVNDPHTGDSKTQQESRRGDVVQGSYSLVDPDGTRRTVEYSADDHNGFNAVVHREPLAVKAVAQVAAPVAYAAPAVARVAAPAIGLGYSGLGYSSGLGYASGLSHSSGLGYASGLGYSSGLGYAGGLGYASGLGYAGGLGYATGGLGYSKTLLH